VDYEVQRAGKGSALGWTSLYDGPGIYRNISILLEGCKGSDEEGEEERLGEDGKGGGNDDSAGD
jgi:hypothetical protein